MNKIIIDGYNLLKSRAFAASSEMSLEAQRDHLIRLLRGYAARHRRKITIAFDNSLFPGQHTHQEGRVKVVFSRPGQEADEVIKRFVRKEKDKQGLIVVSSDREIQYTAKDHGVKVVSSEEFSGQIKHSPVAKKRKSNSDAPAASGKYGANISEKEVQYWKKLFEEGKPDD